MHKLLIGILLISLVSATLIAKENFDGKKVAVAHDVAVQEVMLKASRLAEENDAILNIIPSHDETLVVVRIKNRPIRDYAIKLNAVVHVTKSLADGTMQPLGEVDFKEPDLPRWWVDLDFPAK